QDILIVDENGLAVSFITDVQKDISDTPSYTKGMNGETYVSSPVKLFPEATNMVMNISAPLWKEGVEGTEIVGVVVLQIDAEVLSALTDEVVVGKTGSTYIIDKTGTAVAHKNRELVMNGDNTIKAAETDPSLKSLAALEEDMTKGNTAMGEYTYAGVAKFMIYAPIDGTDGWSIAVTALQSEFLAGTFTNIVFTAIIAIVMLFIAVMISIALARSISKPVKLCAERIELLKQGDLHAPVPVINTKDETRTLGDSTKFVIAELSAVVNDISTVLGNLAAGDLTAHSDQEYTGDFIPIKTAIQTITASFNETMLHISQTAEQVAGGSSEVANGAQALSQGATEQASAIEELSATIKEMSDQIKNNAESASMASQETQHAGQEMEISNNHCCNERH
ncbi:MAG: cache domain-containing protein, partial [Oscillospiraceae bacterium]